MDALYKLLSSESTWWLLPLQASFLLGLGFFVLSSPTLYATYPNVVRRSGHSKLLNGSGWLIVPYSGLLMCAMGFQSASRAAARFTGNHFFAAWSETLAVLSAIILLVGLPMCMIAMIALRKRLANLSLEQGAVFERKSLKATVYVLAGILLLTTVLSSIRV